MPRKGTRDPKIILAWAVEVSLAQLVSRIMAYVETKATITTFKLAARESSPLKNLPQEILGMIASEVQESVFAQKMKYHVRKMKCLINECDTRSHFSTQEINSTAACVGVEPYHKRFVESFGEEAHVIYQRNVENDCHMLQHLGEKKRFAKALQVFTNDFDIEPYSSVQKTWDDGYLCNVHVRAYSMRPLYKIQMKSSLGDETGDFAICQNLEELPNGLVLTKARKDSFRDAARALKLHAYDPDEDESLWEKLDSRHSSNLDGSEYNSEDGRGDDSDSETSDDAPDQAEKEGCGMHDDILPSSDVTEKLEAEETKVKKLEELTPRLMVLGYGESAAGYESW